VERFGYEFASAAAVQPARFDRLAPLPVPAGMSLAWAS
jgi:hypothetical protein